MTGSAPVRAPAGGASLLFPLGEAAAHSARFLVVVPPFASPDRPSIGAHIVARTAADCGYPAHVLYANLSFAAALGVSDYARLCHTATGHLLGERIFARAMYGAAAPDTLDKEAEELLAEAARESRLSFAALQEIACDWADFYAARLAILPAQIVGFTSTFEQTLASLALIERLKARAPDKRVLIGGANADGPMAEGLASLSAAVDHVFAGESEASLAAFLATLDAGAVPPRIIKGTANQALDALPAPDYIDFESQLDATVSDRGRDGGVRREDLWVPYESSRGCWWGAKHHCTFCGLNALGMAYRAKAPEKVLAELGALAERHPEARIMMVDNIMPHSYFTSLIPELARRPHRPRIFYEQKANLGLRRMRALADAGVDRIQPGIESLDSTILALMRKGSTLRTNLECLRYARGLNIDVAWNLIVDFPGEEDAAYEGMIALIPNLVHLQPPAGISPLSIERFSPYFDEHDAFGITNLRPIPAYAAAHPPLADTSAIAYHFQGDYSSCMRRRPDLAAQMGEVVSAWCDAWTGDAPVPLLEVIALGEDRYIVCDTRPGADVEAEIVGPEEARACLTGTGDPERLQWAVERRYVWRADGTLLPLAVGSDDCLTRFIAN